MSERKWLLIIMAFLLIMPYAVAVKPSYFVLTNNTYTSDLGNLTGADSKCLTDLSDNPWLGKNSIDLSVS